MQLTARRRGLEHFLAERMPVLAEFMEQIGLPNAPQVLVEANRFLPGLDAFMADQEIGEEDRTWIHTRLGYYVGEWLVQGLGGVWFLNQIPDSRFFLRYVVGQFANVQNRDAMVDPFEVALTYMSEPPSRSLSAILLEVEDELRSLPG